MERADRRLSNRFTRNFMLAVDEHMGSYCLHMMLRQAGLERFVPQLPPANDDEEISAFELAAFQKSLRDYYGTGARGSLIRIGQRTLDLTLQEARFPQNFKFFIFRFAPVEARLQMFLEYIARILQKSGKTDSVYWLDRDMIFVDPASDATCNQTASEPICWATLGMIHEAVLIATGSEADIVEIACRAMGEDACKFKISRLP